jgi:lysophospholipase L1-like esterase
MKRRYLHRLAGVASAIVVMMLVGSVSAEQPARNYHIALGDSVAEGQGASVPELFGYAGIFGRFYRPNHRGTERFVNLAVSGESSFTFLGGQMAHTLETIDDPSTEIQVITLTIGANDLLPLLRTEPCASDPVGAPCRLAVASALTAFAGGYLAILSQLNYALAQDPGEGRVLVTTYYNPFDGTGDPLEAPVDQALLGSDGAVDCAANKENPARMGLNDIIGCFGEPAGAEVVDIYPLFNDDAPALTHIAEGDIHPNDDGHRAIAEAVIAAYQGN